MDAEQLGEGMLNNLESCIDEPAFGTGEKFNCPVCGQEKMVVIINSDVLPEDALWYKIHC